MSKSSHKKAAHDASRPLSHRASHARSYVNCVAGHLGTSRAALLRRVAGETGVDLEAVQSEELLLVALRHLEALDRAAG
jgi:hypothetical protein